MKSKLLSTIAACLLLTGCWGGRYVSADKDLEDIYVGKSYYEVLEDFGRPDATVDDGMQGTQAVYNTVSLNGTRAARLYRQFQMRNRVTHMTGEPVGGVVFLFNAKMRCYAVHSDFQHKRVKVVKEKEQPRDPRRWAWERPRVPRSIDFPSVESCSVNAENISVEKVEVKEDCVKVYFRYHGRTPVRRPIPDYGISIMPEVYIEDAATGARSGLIEAQGISLYPEMTEFAHNDGGFDMLNYTLVFEPIGREVLKINVIEPGHSGYNFYGIDVSTKLEERLD